MKYFNKKKEVHCYNCGFLCGQVQKGEAYNEITLEGRKNIKEKKGVGILGVLCYRGLLGQKNLSGTEQVLTEPRECIYYWKHEPGWLPKDHMELQQKDKTNRMLRTATLLGAGIGAAAAIIAQLTYAAITN